MTMQLEWLRGVRSMPVFGPRFENGTLTMVEIFPAKTYADPMDAALDVGLLAAQAEAKRMERWTMMQFMAREETKPEPWWRRLFAPK